MLDASLTARRRGCVDVLCAIEDDDDVFEDMVEIFTSGIRGEARRADPTKPLARLVRVDAVVDSDDVARRGVAGYDDVLFRGATRGRRPPPRRSVPSRRVVCNLMVGLGVDSVTVHITPRRGVRRGSLARPSTRRVAALSVTVVDWESAAAFCDAAECAALVCVCVCCSFARNAKVLKDASWPGYESAAFFTSSAQSLRLV